MFKTEGDLIKLTRANKAIITVTPNSYTFKVGDIIEFKVYKEKGLDQLPVLYKRLVVETAGPSFDTELTPEETNIGDPMNDMVEYWYEIELNNDTSIVCYDDVNGPKILELYPKGVDPDDISKE